MRILVIGNGFDLEHKLKTSYTDFLDCASYVLFYLEKNKQKELDVELDSLDYYRNGFGNIQKEHPDVIEELAECIIGNVWINYFLKRKNSLGKTWIDFEKEISKIINLFGLAEKEYNRRAILDTDMIKPYDILIKYYDVFRNREPSLFVDGPSLNDELLRLKNDLNKLIRALEIYLYYWVENTDLTVMNPDIMSINPDCVISFNYTHTFDRLYNDVNEPKYCYIHGSLEKNSSIKDCNMVLGIEDSENDIDNRYIFFKKFFQRLQKETDISYKEWINSIDSQKKIELFIFGHSLDITDKEILEPIISKNNVYTTVYCHNKDKVCDLKENLIRMMKKEVVKDKIEKREIIFAVQSESREIQISELPVIHDLNNLRNAFSNGEIFKNEFDSLVDKIIINILNINTEYFYNIDYLYQMVCYLEKYGVISRTVRISTEKLIEIFVDNNNGDLSYIPHTNEKSRIAEKICSTIIRYNFNKTYSELENSRDSDSLEIPFLLEEDVSGLEQAYNYVKLNKDQYKTIVEQIVLYLENNSYKEITSITEFDNNTKRIVDCKEAMSRNLFSTLIKRQTNERNEEMKKMTRGGIVAN